MGTLTPSVRFRIDPSLVLIFFATKVRLLRGLLVTSNRKHGKKEGCEALVRWLYNGPHDQTLLCVKITEVEFKEMKEQSAAGTERMLATANAGSSLSNLSEAYSFELLTVLLSNRIELVKTETEIAYDDEQSKITDYLFETLAGERFGVSVTRACGKDFEARPLLVKKLFGVIESTRNVSQKDAWRKQLLHVWCESEAIAEAVRHCYESEVDEALKSDTFVLLTVVADGQFIDEIFYASDESATIMRRGGITIANVKGVFAKEIAKNRPSYDLEPKVSAQALACRSHEFFGDLLGGLRCQVCSFETTGRVWKCSRGCDVALCGACMDKWKRKINEY